MPSGCRGCASGIGSCAGSALRGALTTDHQVHREAACNERHCREHEIRFVVHQLLARSRQPNQLWHPRLAVSSFMLTEWWTPVDC